MSKGLAKSAGIHSSMTLLSRLSGLARDQIYATHFGAGAAMDAFLVAFRIPNFMRRISGEGAFSMAFVPVLQAYRDGSSEREVREFIDKVAGTLIAGLLVLTGLAILLAPLLMRWFAPGFAPDGEQFRLATELLRITFPYVLLISLVAMAGGILNSYGRFAVPALSPLLLNLSLIVAALAVSSRLQVPVRALAWGVTIAGVLQLAFHIPSLMRLGLLPKPKWGGSDAGVRAVLRRMGPGILGSSVSQVNLLLNTVVATMLAAGSVTWLYYADRLLEFPLGIFGVAIGTVILPNLASHYVQADHKGYSRSLDWGFRLCLLIGVPACIGLALCAKPVVATLFHYGRFNATDLEMTSRSIIAQALAIPAFLLVKVLAPAFYARQDARTPLRAALYSLLANALFVCAGIAIWMLATEAGREALQTHQHHWLAAAGSTPGVHVVLSLAIATAAWVNALVLGAALHRHQLFEPQGGWLRFLVKIAVAATLMAAVVWSLGARWTDWSTWHFGSRIWHLGLMIGAGVATYGLTLLAMGLRARDFKGH